MSASRLVVFVLGTSRSGTSAITRILSLAGMSLPANLMEPNVGNPTGYWEPNEVVALNDAFLERRRSSYYDPTLFVQSDDTAYECESARAFVSAIATYIASHAGDAPLLIKDPRLAALAPYWYRGCARAGRTVHCILPVRDPQAAIASLAQRDGASFEYANVLWLKYTLLAERVSRRYPRVFVDYGAMVADWRSQLERIESEFSFSRRRRIKRAVRSFVDPRLGRRARSIDASSALLPLTETVFDQLSQAANGASIDARVMDRAFEAFVERESEFATNFARPQDREFYRPGDEIAKWNGAGLRFARALAKGPPFPSA